MRKNLKKFGIFFSLAIFCSFFTLTSNTFAEDSSSEANGFSMSPMYETITLNPGESYTNFFVIAAPADTAENFRYKVYTQGYYKDDDNNTLFEDVEGRSQITQWTTINSDDTGTLDEEGATRIYFTINVPEDAPAGGQYEVITVSSSYNSVDDNGNSIVIQENIAMGYTVYAEITGDVIHQGEILDLNVPSFITSGSISGSSTVKNNGNTHSTAKYTLQVFPLFSDEEIYTNEEDPAKRLVLPDRSFYFSTVWEETPDIGIFKVKYTVEFEGETQIVENIVIKCPLWLLFVIIFAVILLILWIIAKSKSRKKSTK